MAMWRSRLNTCKTAKVSDKMRRVLSFISTFFSWWTSTLSECLPTSARKVISDLLLAEDVNTAVVFEPELIRLYAIDKELVREIGHAAENDKKAVRDLMKSANRREELIVAIPHDRVMHRTMSFPRKAESDLASALQFVVEQVTPVKSEEARWDWRVSRRDPQDQSIDVELYVAPSWVVDEALDTAKQLSIPLTRVDVLNAERTSVQRINLARSASTFKLPRLKPGFAIALVFAVLATAGLVHSAWRQDIAATEASAQLEKVRTAAQPVLEKRVALQKAQERLVLMNEVQSSTVPAAEVIDELARILPDGTWLFEMSTRGLEITISGESDQASALLALIDSSSRFNNAKFSSALTRGVGDGTERFVISFEVMKETTS